jgi:prepilin-type N-terminal cleavage/methylation domain-containing protein
MKASQISATQETGAPAHGSKGGFTLVEVVLSIAIMSLVLYGLIATYTQVSFRAEWSGCSMAAQALGLQQVEQARSAVWDWSIGKNEITNLTLNGWTYNASTGVGSGYSYATLDLPVSGTNIVVATNYVTVKMLYFNGVTNPPVQMQMVTVSTVWPFNMLGRMRYFTNTTATYYGPDNRDASSL